ncbi:MAG: M61 family metallopeptidase [Bacteriovoracaceae bacterium]
MKVQYLVEVMDPSTHIVKVSMSVPLTTKGPLSVFLPSWSPGSYLMREYSRHVRSFRALAQNGEVLFFEQKKKGLWEIDQTRSQLKQPNVTEISIHYEVYCHELTVRTSHVDNSHAFLHGPTYLMGVAGENLVNPELTLRFSPLWSKVSTGLKDISPSREIFRYTAANYDELVDGPIEIGCHETDGFMVGNIPHELAFYGVVYPHKNNLKEDMKKIVEVVSGTMGSMPYSKYTFITHFVPRIYGGLEHLNSTALHFDGKKIGNRKDYINWLALVAHEYFHLWNVKRIRPQELGPFDYLNEGYTSMLWLAEGLTSFMDNLFVLKSKLCSLEEYLDLVKSDFDVYFSTPGRKFHSLEDSSFNAWIKLYRPDENSKNSSISYYLKGGLVFSVLNIYFHEQGHSFTEFLNLLWQSYVDRPAKGLSKEEVYSMVEKLGGKAALDTFVDMVETTKEIDFENTYARIGLKLNWESPKTPYLGVEFDFKEERVFVRTVLLDSPAYKCGLNAGDEILSLNGLRFLKSDAIDLVKITQVGVNYELLVSRLERIENLTLQFEEAPRAIREIQIVDRDKVLKALGV